MNTPLFYQCYPNLQRLKEDATVNRIENNVVVNCKEFLAMHGKNLQMVYGNSKQIPILVCQFSTVGFSS